ncbi:hypothetical protein BpHYR1_030818 [Brachionus plicatilis]|uniref:Uncharacterized protein n=1 Tax=Brachionus plicatilis TaxID=10195 RepID=A0A3M7PBK0_BRAPC|nr:hypothetical protein BpHYR1_030818 [Brachionus plicatilis]
MRTFFSSSALGFLTQKKLTTLQFKIIRRDMSRLGNDQKKKRPKNRIDNNKLIKIAKFKIESVFKSGLSHSVPSIVRLELKLVN